MTDTRQLIEEWVKNGSEPAFRELVTRYVGLVYSAAVRMVNGDTHMAEDITQVVFTDLARKARALSPEVMLGGWLHRHTCFVAANAIRGDRRRQNRERLSVEMNASAQNSEPDLPLVAPILDEAINQLGEEDRRAILLRFFEERDYCSIGQTLGSTEEAARKRVNRALEKLHALLAKRGLTVSAAALTAIPGATATNAAPVGLAASISTTALSTAGVSATAWGFLRFMASTQVKAGLVSSVVIAGTVTSMIIHQQSESRILAAQRELQQQAEQGGELRPASPANPLSSQDELARMREEVAALRQRVTGLPALQAESERLRTTLRQARGEIPAPSRPDASPPPEAMARSRYCRDLAMALMLYASDHQDQFPKDFSEVMSYMGQVTSETNLVPSQFEIVYQGSRDELTNYAHPGGLLLLREKVPWKGPDGRWYKGYASTDGGGYVHTTKDGDFTAWEERRLLRRPKP